MNARFETFEHTADVGLRVFGETLERLFENAAYGLCSMLVRDLDSVTPTAEVPVELESLNNDDLLVEWLNDRLYRFDAFDEIHAWPRLERVAEGRLRGGSGFTPIDWQRHNFHAEIKSATYHGFRLERRGDIWVAEVILDL
jgi:SHS2 domain-containing protein